MKVDYAGGKIGTVSMCLLIGFICVFYNRPIANEIARLYVTPVRWLVGDKWWLSNTQHYISLWARLTLYGCAVISSLIIALKIISMLHLL